MRTFNSDYIVGRANEEKYLPCLQNAFNDATLSHTKCKSHIFDYIGDNKYIELKTRSFEHSKYPDTMIGLNKIEYAQSNPDKEFYFVFAFTNGLYYYKYNSTVASTISAIFWTHIFLKWILLQNYDCKN